MNNNTRDTCAPGIPHVACAVRPSNIEAEAERDPSRAFATAGCRSCALCPRKSRAPEILAHQIRNLLRHRTWRAIRTRPGTFDDDLNIPQGLISQIDEPSDPRVVRGDLCRLQPATVDVSVNVDLMWPSTLCGECDPSDRSSGLARVNLHKEIHFRDSRRQTDRVIAALVARFDRQDLRADRSAR
jgi:hypothetical protein